jgi:hypothetical protein
MLHGMLHDAIGDDDDHRGGMDGIRFATSSKSMLLSDRKQRQIRLYLDTNLGL